jgi:hypothetical protein
MVVTSLIKNILPIAVVGLGLAFLYNVIAKPGEATKSAQALSATLSGFGTGIGQVGTGIGSALGSIGAGSAGLLDPLFTLKTLVYGDDVQALNTNESQTVQIRQQEQALTASSTLINDPVANTASDQPGVTPQGPASNTAVPEISTARFPGARVATSTEKSLLSSLTGGLLG